MMPEIAGYNGLFFDFGSYTQRVERPPETIDMFYRDVAMIILGEYNNNKALQTKTWMRQHYNYDRIYHQYYAPILAESKQWI